MKVFLMHRDKDFDPQSELPWNEQALVQDLELDTLLGAMAKGDKFLFDIARTAVLSSLNDPDAITYRQRVLDDCLAHTAIVREIYDISIATIEGEKKVYWSIFSQRSPDAILHRAVAMLQFFLGQLEKLRRVADEHSREFASEGFVRFFGMLTEELGDDYLLSVENHLKLLRFRHGVLMSAKLGIGNKGVEYVVRTPDARPGWLARVLGSRSSYSFAVSNRDEAGARALSDLRGRGINLVANALAQSTDHILNFFSVLRNELGFYVGCLNLQEQLAESGERIALPVPKPSTGPTLSFRGLYDVCLALIVEGSVVGNDANADGKALVMISGANQGGKSTFLRSIGLAQLMMQCGMFVGAESFRSNVCEGLFTHYKREEDATMTSGKLDEELSRMSDIADRVHPNSIVLFNESFASTNEREGSELATQIVCALLDAGVKIFFVTHLFELAHAFYLREMDAALFLRAERQSDGRRTFRQVEGEPLATSYGEDLYRRVFRTAAVSEGGRARGSV
jgi:hypothetical protein